MEVDQPDNPSPVVRSKPYQLIAQKVELDISFDKFVTGRTQLTIFPEYPEVPGILLNARQCQIKKITVNGHATSAALYNDPCDVLNLHTRPSVRKSHVLSEKLAGYVSYPAEPELFIPLPEGVSIEETANVIASVDTASKSLDVSGLQGNDAEIVDNVTGAAVSKYTPLEVIIEFVSLHTRDALQFAVGAPGSGRWPHVFTKGGFLPGRTSSIFPCMDSVYHRCPWEISLTAARTVGDALKEITGQTTVESSEEAKAYEAKEMVFVCPGDVTDDFVSKTDHSRRTVSYAITSNVSAQQIGFAIGPFEKVDLTKLRESDKVELLQDNAAQISAYCLPGRAAETENTCLATVEALDHFVITQEPFPFSSFSYCFVDDQVDRPATFAGLSVCSSRMLYPDNIIDPAQEVTRTLIQVLASQWMGTQIIPKQPEDAWVVLGSALFLAELFMKELCGNNEYRFRMKRMSDRVCEMDHQRPAIWDMGALLHIDPAEYEFLALKAPLVLYILDRRIHKETGKATMSNTIQKFLTKARYETLKDNMMSTQDFCKAIEKTLHAPIDDFINQWVKGAGCPHFVASQRFNKKKLVIEMTIQQVQANDASDPTLDPDTFMRDVREEFGNVYAASPQHVFTGPMTIRIHEADGSPYEHIIQIKEAVTKVEVPYTTKYKRLKRSKKQRAKNSVRTEGDDEQEAVVYTLGDVLQSEEEIAAWRISEWSEEEEQKMNSESYEWIRLDADFEWIAGLRLQMPGHMFQSQLQQDRDVTAQLVSIKHLELYQAGRLISSILVRTMMDARYFHGIRTAAAQALVKNASNRNNADMIGLFHLTKAFNELYCISDGDSVMPRPNDFSDQQAYLLQGALVDAISRIRSDEGYTPLEVKQFLLDKLRFNDNSSNSYSDAHYVAKLLKALTRSIVARPPRPDEADLQDDLDEAQRWADLEGFERSCLGEIDRYRRMDEWTSSYQNLYSRTALECQSTLIQHGVAKFSAAHFFQYIRPTNYEMLRSTAYEILTNIFLYKDDGILQKVVHGMVANNSPYVRDRIKNAFGKALARRAIGLGRPAQAAPVEAAAAESMVVSDGVVPAPVLDTARLSNVEAALDALKKELAGNAVLERILQQMLTYPEVGFEDISAINDFCRMIYPTQDEARMTLRLPRYWKIEKVGKGRFKFSRTQKTRRKQIKPWKPRTLPIVFPKTIAEPQKKGSTMLKLKMNSQSHQNSISIPAPVPKPIATPTPPTEPPKTTLKLKFGARPSH